MCRLCLEWEHPPNWRSMKECGRQHFYIRDHYGPNKNHRRAGLVNMWHGKAQWSSVWNWWLDKLMEKQHGIIWAVFSKRLAGPDGVGSSWQLPLPSYLGREVPCLGNESRVSWDDTTTAWQHSTCTQQVHGFLFYMVRNTIWLQHVATEMASPERSAPFTSPPHLTHLEGTSSNADSSHLLTVTSK